MQSSVYDQSICLISNIAYSYYCMDMSQNTIAARFGISVPTVSRLLKRAKEEGIVSFSIKEELRDCLKYEQMLKDCFGVSNAFVVPTNLHPGLSEYEKMRMVALEGARYVQRVIGPNDILGIGWGFTIYELIHYLNPCRKESSSFVTLHGSVSGIEQKLDVVSMAKRMAMAFGGTSFTIPYPGMPTSLDEAIRIRSLPEVKEVFSMFKHVTISIAGIGSFYPNPVSRLTHASNLTDDEINNLIASGVYGDILLHFFDAHGSEVNNEVSSRIITIDFNDYLNIPNKVIVASGDPKRNAMYAALSGNLANTIIIDHSLADYLVKANC